MKKILSIGLVLVILLSMMTGIFVLDAGAAAWDGTSVSASLAGEGTASNPYYIGSGADLKYLANAVNMGEKFTGKYFRQTTDIDLGSKEWVPIGYKDDFTFQGHYDGGNHTISNLYITTTHYRTGLFGSVGATSGTLSTECGVANLTVKGTINVNASSSVAVVIGSVVASVNYNKYLGNTQVYVKNVVSEVSLTASGLAKETLVGGACGHVSGALLENVTNKGSITVSGGAADGSNAGVAAQAENSTLRTCLNYGTIKVTTTQNGGQLRAGGIVALYYKQDINQWLTLENCVNTASVYVESTNTSPSIILVGGILGGVNYSAATSTWAATSGVWRNYQITIRNCANTGAITGKIPTTNAVISVGGILGSTYCGSGGQGNNGGGFTIIGCASSGALSNTNSGRTGLIGCVYNDKKANYNILIKDTYCSEELCGTGVRYIKDWNEVVVNSISNSSSRAEARAQAILSTATGDNDTLGIVLVSVLAIGVAFVVTRKFIIKSR